LFSEGCGGRCDGDRLAMQAISHRSENATGSAPTGQATIGVTQNRDGNPRRLRRWRRPRRRLRRRREDEFVRRRTTTTTNCLSVFGVVAEGFAKTVLRRKNSSSQNSASVRRGVFPSARVAFPAITQGSQPPRGL